MNNQNNKLNKQTSNYYNYQMPTNTSTINNNKYEYNNNNNNSSNTSISGDNNRLTMNYYGSDNETFSFQDFISLIINENDVKWHKLIIQDLERILELKFREFKKLFSSSYLSLLSNQINNNNNNNNNQQSQQQQQSNSKSSKLQVCSPNDLFAKISKDIFKTSLEEPNGILGARINMKFLYDGKLIDICRFDYDPCTLTTFEVVVIIKEDVRSIKKLLHAFKLYSNFGKYFTIYIDENNYEFYKRKLY